MNNTLEKVYVLNHPEGKGLDRRKYMIENLGRENIDFEFVDGYHPRDLNQDELQKDFHLLQPVWVETDTDSYWSIPTKLKMGVLSSVMKHIHCWKSQVENKFEYVVIFEDDCEIPLGLGKNLIECIEEMRANDYDLAMLGEWGGRISKNYQPGKHLHFHPLQRTRCVTAYIVNKKAANIIMDGFQVIRNAADIQLNEIIHNSKLKVAWYEPGLSPVFDTIAHA